VLDNVNLRLGADEHLAILGPNGAGKSSLIKTITRQLYPLRGPDSYIRILGKAQWNVFHLKSRLGVVSDDLLSGSLLRPTCREVVLSSFFGSRAIWPTHRVTGRMEERAAETMRFLAISHLADRPIGEVSAGESRLVLIARALVHAPPTLLLDEPTANLDPRASQEMREMLRRITGEGKSIIMITHDLSDIIPEISRVITISGGRITHDGDKDEVLTAEVLSGLFGIRLEVVKRNGYYHGWSGQA
jgi:iron complex transport system ATP-binding protein